MTIDDRLSALTGMSPAARLVRVTQVRSMCRSGAAAEIRRRARATRLEVAAAVGVTESAVADWEAARYLPTGGRALRYGEVLDTLRSASGVHARPVLKSKPRSERRPVPPSRVPGPARGASPAEGALMELIHLLANPGPPDPPEAPAVHRTDTTQDHERNEESHG